MTVLYREEEVVARVSSLTRDRLVEYRAAEIVVPMEGDSGPVYRQLDVARLELACDLGEQYEMEAEAISMVLSLIDQLHGLRAEMREVLRAVEDQPEPVRAQIAEAIRKVRFPE